MIDFTEHSYTPSKIELSDIALGNTFVFSDNSRTGPQMRISLPGSCKVPKGHFAVLDLETGLVTFVPVTETVYEIQIDAEYIL